MSKKPISQKRADREKQESQALHRVFNVFLLGLAAECYLLLVYRGYAMGTIDSLLIWHQILTWGMYLGLVMLIVGIAVGVAKRKDRRLRTIMAWVAGGGLFLALTGWVVTFFFDNSRGITAMCVLVPIAVVLALVYLLFQPECFLCTLTVSCAMFAVWARGASADSSAFGMVVIAGCVVGALLLAAAAYLVSKAQKDEGKLWGVRVLTPECDYRVVYGVLAVALVCVALAAAAAPAAYYLLWVLGILLFAELVYHTTRLM